MIDDRRDVPFKECIFFLSKGFLPLVPPTLLVCNSTLEKKHRIIFNAHLCASFSVDKACWILLIFFGVTNVFKNSSEISTDGCVQLDLRCNSVCNWKADWWWSESGTWLDVVAVNVESPHNCWNSSIFMVPNSVISLVLSMLILLISLSLVMFAETSDELTETPVVRFFSSLVEAFVCKQKYQQKIFVALEHLS